MESAGCCGCTMDEAPLPLQSAVNHEVIRPLNINEEVVFASPEQDTFLATFGVLEELFETNSHAPPLIKSHVNSPLIC